MSKKVKNIKKTAEEMEVLMQKPVWSTSEAAWVLGIGINTMCELINTGRVPHFKIGRTNHIPRETFLEWMNREAIQVANKNDRILRAVQKARS